MNRLNRLPNLLLLLLMCTLTNCTDELPVDETIPVHLSRSTISTPKDSMLRLSFDDENQLVSVINNSESSHYATINTFGLICKK